MGARGPIPKRSTERAGHRAKADKPDKAAATGTVSRPEPDPEWYPLVTDWYAALSESGQSQFFEPTDWAYARILADLLTAELTKTRRSSEMVKAILAAMDNLGTTEGARRRMRIEVERETAAPVDADKVAVMERYRAKAAGGD